MDISPGVPLVGLVVIVANILVAALSPRFPPRLMGVQLFFSGMVVLTLSVVSLINPVGITEATPHGIVGLERALLFIMGSINCWVGYYMVLLESRR
jgi:hypothetical protein